MAVSFNRSNPDIIDCGIFDWDPGLSECTIMAWVNYGIDNQDMVMFSKTTDEKKNNYIWGLEYKKRGELTWRLKHGGTVTDITGAFTPTTGVWHHMCLRYNGSVAEATIDGTILATTAISGTLDTDNSKSIAIGATPEADRLFSGEIDDFRIYTRALADNEIQLIREMDGQDFIYNELFAHWQLSELSTGVPGTVYDYGKNKFNGTVSAGSPAYSGILRRYVRKR